MTVIDRTTEIDVTGMTCAHCVNHVNTELKKLPDVQNVEVILKSGGASRVTVVSNVELNDADLREAIDEAGYEVTAIRRDN